MSKYDGKVTISTAIDNGGIEKDLREVEGEFGGLTKTVKETEKAIDKAFSEAGKRKVQLTGVQYDSKEIERFVNEYVSGLNKVEKHSNGMRDAFEEAQKKVEELEKQGFWWGDEEYEKAYAALDRIKKDIQEAEHFATSQPEPANPFGTDTIAGKVQEAKNQLAALAESGKGLGTEEYDEAYAALARLTQEEKKYRKSLTETSVPPSLDTYEGKILSLQNALNNLRNAGKGLGDPAYDEIYRKLAIAKAEAKKYAAELAKTPEEARKAANETKKLAKNATKSKNEFGELGKSVNSFVSRLKSIALGALLFNGISAGLREFTSYLGETLKTNETFTTVLSRLKGALLTAFQPIYSAVAPAVTYLMRILTGATLVVAEFFASITGTTVDASAEAAKGLYEEVNAIESVGKAAKKAGRSMAGFDELNVLQGKTDTSGSSGSSDAVTPDFSVNEWFSTEQLDAIKDAFKEIAGYIGVAAAGLVGFKLGSFVADLLTSEKKAKSLKTLLSQLGKKAGLVIGITLAITGIALETKGIVTAIQEGLSGGSLLDILGGGAMITSGGAMIGNFFGKGILGGAVGAIVAGIPAYITGIYDACMNGLNWLNATLIAAGSTAAGAGIGAIIGSAAGPMGIAIGGLIGLATGLITDGILAIATDQVEPTLDILTEAEREFMAAADQAAEAFRQQQKAAEENRAGITIQMDYVEGLADELGTLADETGRVKKEDEKRVNFILNELKKATGEEYELVDGVIQRYGELKTNIDEVIESKKANLLLDASAANYTKAIEEKDAAYDNLVLSEKDYLNQLDITMQKENEYNEALAAWNAAMEEGNHYEIEAALQRKDIAEGTWNEEKKILDEKKIAWEDNSLAYQQYSNTITNYEDAMAASLSGNYEEAVEILGRKEATFGNYAKTVDTETAKVLDALLLEAIEAEKKAKVTKENFEKGVAGFTKEMVDEAEKGYQEALDAYANAYADAQGVGEDMGDGLSDGMESKRTGLIDKAKSLVSNILEAMRKAADSHSPSKKTIALGEDIGVGPGIGIENETDSAVKAAENQVEAVIDAYESQSAVDSGKNFGGTFADGIYSSVKKISAAGARAAKTALNALNVNGNGCVSVPSWYVSTPRIPQLARGAVLPANRPFLAMVGDQRHGTNVEAPLSTIQEAVALVMQDQTSAILAGFEASVGVQREILEAVLGIQIGDDVIGSAVSRYNSKQAVIRGGAL